MNIDPERTTGLDIIQIGTMDIPVERQKTGCAKQSGCDTNSKGYVANDHEPAEASLVWSVFCQDGALPA
jgi:hypothetical protein